MVAESVSSHEFRAAYERLPEQLQFEVTWAVEEIEQDPAWVPPYRYLAPFDSPFSGFIIDFSVEGYGIVYRVVDHGAAIELWQLFDLPPPPKAVRAVRPGPLPMM